MIKVCCYKLQISVFVYNYVILECSVFFFFDLRQMLTTVFFSFSTVMCGDIICYGFDMRILTAM